jgi:rSAM/selenodomain-associated transferase 2
MTLSLSIVIPVAPGETALSCLLDDLSRLAGVSEILVVTAETDSEDPQSPLSSFPSTVLIRRIGSPPGRARQMNLGAAAAQGEFLWFLHADTIVTPQAWEALRQSLQKHPGDLHYFDLKFHRDGPLLMKLNTWGVRLRSHWFKMPFGDQGFCLPANRFHELGGYDESLACGEDHALVWTARTAGLKVRSTGAAVETSARKYRQHGWCRTTLTHFWLTWKQALPRYARLLRKRWLS